MKNVMPIILLFFVFTLFSCDKKEEKKTANCSLDFIATINFQNELAGISTAAQAYAEEQSDANCNNYKNAYRNYINAIGDVLDCFRQFDLEKTWEEAIKDAEDSIASIC